MRVEIVRSDPNADGVVIFRTERGEARAVWRGDSPPMLGETDVELMIKGQVRWGVEVVVAGSEELPGVGPNGAVVATVDGVEADGVLKLRLADGLTMIAPEGRAPVFRVGDKLKVRDVEIDLYPEHM